MASDLSPVKITSPGGECSAEFVPGANLVCSSLRHRGEELLDAGRGVRAYAEQGKTMGIPLLYPWANRLSHRGYAVAGRKVALPDAEGRYPLDPGGLPIHGALPGELVWELAEHEGDRLRAVLRWDAPALRELFPFSHEVQVSALVDERGLTLETVVGATGSDQVPVAFGYHPYLTIPGSDRRGWQVDLGAAARLELDEAMIPTGQHEPLTHRDFLLDDESWDDGLAELATPPQFIVSDGERALSVTFEAGYEWAQVYAPPGHDFICFEPMTAPTDALNSHTGLEILEPGGEYRARFSVSVLP